MAMAGSTTTPAFNVFVEMGGEILGSPDLHALNNTASSLPESRGTVDILTSFSTSMHDHGKITLDVQATFSNADRNWSERVGFFHIPTNRIKKLEHGHEFPKTLKPLYRKCNPKAEPQCCAKTDSIDDMRISIESEAAPGVPLAVFFTKTPIANHLNDGTMIAVDELPKLPYVAAKNRFSSKDQQAVYFHAVAVPRDDSKHPESGDHVKYFLLVKPDPTGPGQMNLLPPVGTKLLIQPQVEVLRGRRMETNDEYNPEPDDESDNEDDGNDPVSRHVDDALMLTAADETGGYDSGMNLLLQIIKPSDKEQIFSAFRRVIDINRNPVTGKTTVMMLTTTLAASEPLRRPPYTSTLKDGGEPDQFAPNDAAKEITNTFAKTLVQTPTNGLCDEPCARYSAMASTVLKRDITVVQLLNYRSQLTRVELRRASQSMDRRALDGT
ncbi:hypothetical protein CSOJ01_14240 [Colletotrichum sojae]|uniref:Uncharacterized protein n=1 Tax=Colletotrichum sojae TaxID=2175907 RepID=A0A8H6IR24_9PEZI|nr:hypothetical protein CSOJ01_14240 [Colletotrichum sojae]